MRSRTRKLPIVGVLIVGVGMIIAPFVFQMFSRAPLGGDMINDFEPYMTVEQVDRFRGYLAEIDAANTESVETLRADLVASGAVSAADYDTVFASVVNLNEQWPTIDTDMSDLIDRMEANLDSYAAVAALPPFPMFPWFFVVPGALIAAAAGVALYQRGRPGHSARPALWVAFGLGLAVVAAPVAFQMFDRAPQGKSMIDDFRPMMTRDRVQAVQGYFVTLGAAEGQLRANALPMLVAAGGDPSTVPAIGQWSTDWPTILTDFNPMVATMSDNVDNYEAVDALPPFDLFPWFFVIPGVLVAGLAAVALWSRPRSSNADDEATAEPPEVGDVSSPPNSPALSGKESS
jgi:hypothetical protein